MSFHFTINKAVSTNFTRQPVAKRHKTYYIHAMPDTGVVANYLQLYSDYICNVPNPITCMENMVIPPPYEQQRIVVEMFEMSTRVDMEGLEEVFLKLFIAGDQQKIDILEETLELYNKSKDAINAIVRYTQLIPISDGRDIDVA
jgi:hypothetical protein